MSSELLLETVLTYLLGSFAALCRSIVVGMLEEYCRWADDCSLLATGAFLVAPALTGTVLRWSILASDATTSPHPA